MKRFRWLGIVTGGGITLLLLAWLTLLMVDPAELFGVVTRLAGRQGMTVTARSISRTLPLGIRMESVTIATDRPIVTIDRLDIKVPLRELISGNPTLLLHGTVGEGWFTITTTGPTSPRVTIDARQIRLERIPLLTSALSGSVTGGVSLSGTIEGVPPRAGGEIRLDSRGIETRSVAIGGVPLPDSIYRSLRGSIAIRGDKLEVKSLSLDGDGIYLRLSGSIPLTPTLLSAPLGMALEILPRPEFVERQNLVFSLLSRFLTSPGSYRLPVSGTLTAPRIF